MTALALVLQADDPRDLAGFETWMRSWGASPSTVRERMQLARRFVAAHPGFPDVGPEDVALFLSDPSWSRNSRSTYFKHLRSLFTWVEAADLGDDVTAKMRRPKASANAPKPLTQAQMDGLLEDASPLVRSYLVLGFYAGLRAHEIAKIRGEDVEPDRLYVDGKGGKQAWLPTHPLVWQEALQRPRIGWWYPSGPDRGPGLGGRTAASGHVLGSSVGRATHHHLRRHGIEGSIHRARHTYATRLLRTGTDIRTVQRLMRHSSLATTEMYLGVDDVDMSSAVGRL